MTSLRQLAEDLWIYDATFTTMGLPGSTRMTVIRLSTGLLVHSPVHLTEDAQTALITLGPVSYVLAPNNMHFLYFEEFLNRHPQASGFVSPALIRKHPRFSTYAPASVLQPLVSEAVEMAEVKGHAIGETVLFHKPSATLITSDLLYNLQPEHGRFEKAVMRTLNAYGKPCVPCYHRISVQNRPLLRAAIQKIASWPFQRIIMAHGRVIESPAAPHIFTKAWQWA